MNVKLIRKMHFWYYQKSPVDIGMYFREGKRKEMPSIILNAIWPLRVKALEQQGKNTPNRAIISTLIVEKVPRHF